MAAMASGPAGGGLPPEIDPTRPQTARMYDYLLGGKDHFDIDRETMETGLRSWPGARVFAQENRRFLARAVEYLTREAGVRQFLDIGSGLPSANNVHEVAQRFAPDSRVVYVDNDPLVMAHAQVLLTSGLAGRTAFIQADLRQPDTILANPVLRDTLDFSQPVALMLNAILHFIHDDDEPGAIVSTLMAALPPGSYLVSTHVTAELDPDSVHGLERIYRAGGLWAGARTGDEFRRMFFDELDLVPPGLVPITDWHPVGNELRPPADEVNANGAVGRKRPASPEVALPGT
jgi:S-adenosyl methyltransferase